MPSSSGSSHIQFCNIWSRVTLAHILAALTGGYNASAWGSTEISIPGKNRDSFALYDWDGPTGSTKIYSNDGIVITPLLPDNERWCSSSSSTVTCLGHINSTGKHLLYKLHSCSMCHLIEVEWWPVILRYSFSQVFNVPLNFIYTLPTKHVCGYFLRSNHAHRPPDPVQICLDHLGEANSFLFCQLFRVCPTSRLDHHDDRVTCK